MGIIRFIIRFLALVALAVAIILAVVDATRSLAASRLVTTPLGQSWKAISPDTLEMARNTVELYLWPAVWDTLAGLVLGLPGFAVFAVLAFILYALGNRPVSDRRGVTFDI